MNFFQRAAALQKDTIRYRRHFHMYPEPSGAETETAKYISDRLSEFGIEHKVLPCNSVIGYISGGAPGKCVALRADIDALCTDDCCSAEYRSQNAGAAHVCGHDFHAAALLSAARMLQENREKLKGQVKLIFQHSEEKPPSGAEELVNKYAVMDGVDAIYGLHIINDVPTGKINVQAGPRMSGSMNFYVDVKGRGGHGSTPHVCIDPILASCAMIMNLQSIVSREMPPDSAVSVTVGCFTGGTAHNSVADSAHFEAGIKCLNGSLRQQIRDSVERILSSTAQAYRCEVSVRYTEFGLPLVNDEALAAIAERSAKAQFGEDNVVPCPPWLAAEDFTKYLAKVPGVFAFLGGRNEDKGFVHLNHHPAFDSDEEALAVGAAAYAAFAWDYLAE